MKAAPKMYKALKKGFVNNQLVQEGDIFQYDGEPGEWMDAVDKSELKAIAKEQEADQEAEEIVDRAHESRARKHK